MEAGGKGDATDQAFRRILVDGRRPLPEETEREAKELWRRVFQKTPGQVLVSAVETWLLEHPRGRPGVGEVMACIRRISPKTDENAIRGSSSGKSDFNAELKWAVSILAACDTDKDWRERLNLPNNRHTLDSAKLMLRKRGFRTWQEARAYMEPVRAPSSSSEV